MESTIIFLSVVILFLCVVIIRLARKNNTIRENLRAQVWETSVKEQSCRAAEKEADHWCSSYSRADRERTHLQIEVNTLRGLLMAKQGAGEN